MLYFCRRFNRSVRTPPGGKTGTAATFKFDMEQFRAVVRKLLPLKMTSKSEEQQRAQRKAGRSPTARQQVVSTGPGSCRFLENHRGPVWEKGNKHEERGA